VDEFISKFEINKFEINKYYIEIMNNEIIDDILIDNQLILKMWRNTLLGGPKPYGMENPMPHDWPQRIIKNLKSRVNACENEKVISVKEYIKSLKTNEELIKYALKYDSD
jgi:hypothetical protein